MKFISEKALIDFDFWAGAREIAAALTSEDLDTIEEWLDSQYGGVVNETAVNDLFWHEPDVIADILGYDDWEDLEDSRKEDEEVA